MGISDLFFNLAPLVIIITVYFFTKSDTYKFPYKKYNSITILKANSLSIITLVTFFYFLASGRISRVVILSYFILSSSLIILSRIISENIVHYLHRRGLRLTYILLIGDGKQTEAYVKIIKSHCLGISITAWLDSNGLAEKYQIPSYPYSTISSLKKDIKLDMITIGYSVKDSKKTDEILKKNYDNIIPIKILPDISYSLIGHHIEDFSGIPIIDINIPRISFIGMALKRLLDIMVSALCLLVLSPFIILIAILIKLGSKGPVFYTQERLSINDVSFNIWKFRSMTRAKNNEDHTAWTSNK